MIITQRIVFALLGCGHIIHGLHIEKNETNFNKMIQLPYMERIEYSQGLLLHTFFRIKLLGIPVQSLDGQMLFHEILDAKTYRN